jgi:hypothetical protein
MAKMRRTVLLGAALAAACAAFAPGHAMAASETCGASSTGIDGYEFNDYFKLTAQRDPADPRTTWICYRAATTRFGQQTGGIDRGGRIDVRDATVSPTLPSVDNQGGACTTTAGNTFPGPRPLVGGQVGDPGDPNYTPFLVDAYLGGSDVWGCLRVGDSLSARVKVSTSGIAAPVVTHVPDAPGTPLPVQKQGPFGYPSNKCLENFWHVRVINMRIQDTHVWLYHWPESATQTAVCVRVHKQGVQPIGYRIVLDTDTSGVTPVVEYSDSDVTPCTETIAAVTSPVQVRLSQSSGISPASVCLEALGLKRRITVGTNGSPRVPLPAIHKDPDSV